MTIYVRDLLDILKDVNPDAIVRVDARSPIRGGWYELIEEVVLYKPSPTPADCFIVTLRTQMAQERRPESVIS